MKMYPVVHFEMPYEDKERMAEFYNKAFGWQTEMLGEDMGNYVIARTTEIDEKSRFPKEPGRINGGFFQKTDDPRSKYTSVVISVDDIQAVMKNVTDAGGTILGGGNKEGEPDDIPGVGKFVTILDSEGNRVGLMEPLPMESMPK